MEFADEPLVPLLVVAKPPETQLARAHGTAEGGSDCADQEIIAKLGAAAATAARENPAVPA